jgi:F0F1-type ATP synthase membrane subunit b/b'
METLFGDVLRHIAASPAPFIAEAVQSVVLIGILVLFGRRYAAVRLEARRSSIADRVAGAGAALENSVKLREESVTVVARANEESPELIRQAREQADREHEAGVAAIETEADEIVLNARQTVEREKNRIRRGLSDRLVGLTTEVARRYLDEVLTESQRRELTQKAILEVLDRMEETLVPEGEIVNSRAS